MNAKHPARFEKILLVLGVGLYLLGNIQRAAVPGAVFDELQSLHSLTTPQVTALGATFMYVYAFMQLLSGLLADRYGGVRILFVGGLLFTAGAFLFPATRSYPLLCLARVLCGLGMSTFYLSLAHMAMSAFPKQYATAVTVGIMIGYFGGCFANGPFLGIVHAVGLVPTLLWLAGLTAACFLLFALFALGTRLPPVVTASLSPGKFVHVLSSPVNRNMFLFLSIHWGLFYGIQTVAGKKFLGDFCRMPSQTAAWILSLVGFLSAVSGVLVALLSRIAGGRQRQFCIGVAWAAFVCVGTVAALTWFDIPSRLPAYLFCCMALGSSLSAVTIPLYKANNRPEDIVTVLAISNCVCYLSVGVFANLAGHLLDLFPPALENGIQVYSARSWAVVFTAMAVCAAISVAATHRIHSSRNP